MSNITSITIQFKNKQIALREIDLTLADFDLIKSALITTAKCLNNAITELEKSKLSYLENDANNQLEKIQELYVKLES